MQNEVTPLFVQLEETEQVGLFETRVCHNLWYQFVWKVFWSLGTEHHQDDIPGIRWCEY